jgi:hypothetical protein
MPIAARCCLCAFVRLGEAARLQYQDGGGFSRKTCRTQARRRIGRTTERLIQNKRLATNDGRRRLLQEVQQFGQDS